MIPWASFHEDHIVLFVHSQIRLDQPMLVSRRFETMSGYRLAVKDGEITISEFTALCRVKLANNVALLSGSLRASHGKPTS
jgi:hypothetical protein